MNCFISYHHKSNFNHLIDLREKFDNQTFKDYGFKDENLDESSKYFISRKIQYRIWASSVSIVLVGEKTGMSKWIDWEIWYSLRSLSRWDFPEIRSKPKGLMAIFLPSSNHHIPYRLKWNLDSGYAIKLDWSDLEFELDNALDQSVRNRDKTHLIRNRSTLKVVLHRISVRN